MVTPFHDRGMFVRIEQLWGNRQVAQSRQFGFRRKFAKKLEVRKLGADNPSVVGNDALDGQRDRELSVLTYPT
jgi:hypothetical protein